ncbi:MAG: SUMF1/EgtB/PvdO family nonheme iron enzyme [Planctomycetota bacterium]
MPFESSDIQRIRIFVSSPGDVAEERNVALSTIRDFQAEYQGRLVLIPILWEQLPLLATAGFQEEIDRRAPPSQSDIALFILWSRLGTPLSRNFQLDDGRRPTGTEWEFADAMGAHAQRGAPSILVYRRVDPPHVAVTDPGYESRRSDWSAVERFFSQNFQDSEDLSFKGSVHLFQAPSEFGRKLRAHLRDELNDRLAGGARAGTWHGTPFRGLEPFDVEHAAVFFGRRRAVEEVRQALSRQIRAGRAFVLILGASGAGKSSLARAGLLSRLTGPWVAEEALAEGFCRQAVVRPGDAQTPLEALASALVREGALPDIASHGSPADLAAAWASSPKAAVNDVRGALVRAAAPAGGGAAEDVKGRLVLLIDQLEELFTQQGVTESERSAFASVVSVLARSGLVWVIATLRSDFYPALLELPELKALKEGDGQYDLLPPDAEEIAEIVRGPAELAALSYEYDETLGRSLDTVLIAEALGGRDALPLLQYALTLLEHEKQADGRLTFAAHAALGGLEGAIGRQADRVWETLSRDARAAFPGVLRALVDVAEGSEVRATARRAPKRLVTSTPEATSLVEAFLAARLLVAEGSATGEVVAVAHEALLRRWERARRLIENDAELLRVQTRLRTEATRWDQAGRPKSWEHWRGRDLDGAKQLRQAGFDLDPAARAYLAAAEGQALRGRRVRRAAAGALVVLAVLAAAAALHARHMQRTAQAALDDKARALDDVLRLADSKEVADLVDEADRLWPLVPERASEMEAWVARAKTVLSRRAEHRTRLAAIREGVPYSEEEKARDLEAGRQSIEAAQRRLAEIEAEKAKVQGDNAEYERTALEKEEGKVTAQVAQLEAGLHERRSWTFADPQTEWQHEVLVALLAGLDRLDGGDAQDQGGILADVEARFAFVTTLRQRSLEDHARAWDETIAGIAASSKYGGLRITRQVGLVPLGPDPESGLFEFAHLGSGRVPTRDDTTKQFVPKDDAAIVLVLIPGGSFLMGAQKKDPQGPNYDPLAEETQEPVHEVSLSPFFLAKHEATQAQWKALTGGLDPSAWKAGMRADLKDCTERNPVEQVSWEDCDLWLSRHRLVLPTEAEWEHACRAGTDTPWITGRDVAALGGVANIADAWLKTHGGEAFPATMEVNDGYGVHAPVGSFAPNKFGLHDVHGNVWEWCRDAYRLYTADAVTDPVVQGKGGRVNRGGGWPNVARYACSARRARSDPGSRIYSIGVRPASTLAP